MFNIDLFYSMEDESWNLLTLLFINLQESK